MDGNQDICNPNRTGTAWPYIECTNCPSGAPSNSCHIISLYSSNHMAVFFTTFVIYFHKYWNCMCDLFSFSSVITSGIWVAKISMADFHQNFTTYNGWQTCELTRILAIPLDFWKTWIGYTICGNNLLMIDVARVCVRY